MYICVYMYACMYVMSDRVIMDHDYFMLMFICTYVCLYVCHWLTRSLLFYVDVCMGIYAYRCLTRSWLFIIMLMYMYVCIHVSMSLSDRSLGTILMEEWLLMQENGMTRFLVLWESSGKSSHDKYKRSISRRYELILYDCIMPMFMLWNVTLKDISVELMAESVTTLVKIPCNKC